MRKYYFFTLLLLLSFLFKGFGQNSWAFVRIDSNGIKRTGIINNKGKVLVPVKYETVNADGSFFFVKLNSLWGCYKEGKNFIPIEYENIGPKISGNLIKVQKKGKWGFVDFNNRIIIPFKYDFACNFYKGIAFVRIGDRNYHITENDKIVDSIKMENEYCPEDISEDVGLANQFRDGLLIVKLENNKYGVIEKESNKLIIPFEYDEIKDYYNNVIKVKKGTKFGAYTNKGYLITNPIYDYIGIFEEY